MCQHNFHCPKICVWRLADGSQVKPVFSHPSQNTESFLTCGSWVTPLGALTHQVDSLLSAGGHWWASVAFVLFAVWPLLSTLQLNEHGESSARWWEKSLTFFFRAAKSCTRREKDVMKAKQKKRLDSRNHSQKALLIYLMIIPVRKCNNKFSSLFLTLPRTLAATTLLLFGLVTLL